MKKGEKRKRQKTLARRTESRKAKATAATQWSQEIAAIHHARTYPILGCWVRPDWRETGLAVVVVARSQPNGRVVFGNYMVDYYCLGVKDCFARGDVSLKRFHEEILPDIIPGGAAEPISVDLAHELVYGGVEYAARWGFAPHVDFEFAQEVLDPPAMRARRGEVTFGRNGKPFFVNGANDDARAVIAQLEKTAGAGNFDYAVAFGDNLEELEEEPPDGNGA